MPSLATVPQAVVLLTLAFGIAVLAPAAASAASCSVSVLGMNFGSYTGALASYGGTPITVNCTAGLQYSVRINAGLHSSGNYNWNMTTGGGALLNYQVFRDSAYSQLFGGTDNFDTIQGVGNGGAQTIYAYGRPPANSSVVPGSYTDSITVAVDSTAGTVTTAMSVMATVTASCSISISTLSFGTYTGLQTDATAIVAATCTNTTTYNVGLNAGQNSSANYVWNMIGPGSTLLTYRLYRDAARSQYWGGSIGVDTPSGTGSGSVQGITVYGRLLAGQYVRPGGYSDVVNFIIYY